MSYSDGKKDFEAGVAGKIRKTVPQESEQDFDAGRRSFMRTIGMGAAALAASACGGGGGGLSSEGGAPALGPGTPSNTASLWYAVPTITFTEGVAASISIAGYVSAPDSIDITKNSAALPPGVTYDAGTKSFIYDGVGAIGYTDGHILTVIET